LKDVSARPGSAKKSRQAHITASAIRSSLGRREIRSVSSLARSSTWSLCQLAVTRLARSPRRTGFCQEAA
jgi:hypothetical protein